MNYFRPFLDKLKAGKVKRWWAFFKDLGHKADRPLPLLAPKIAWGLFRGFNFGDFARYELLTLTWRQIASLHSTFDNVRLIGRLNIEANLYLLRDKGVLLERFSPYLGRAHVDLRRVSFEDFSAFMQRHPVRVAKAYNLAMGAGIEVLDQPYPAEELAALHRRLLDREMFILEEFLQQHEALHRVYPHAINTLRLITLLTGGEARVVLPPLMRFGSGGARIDAIKTVIAMVDPESGRLRSARYNEGPPVSRHPDTGVDFATVTVPFLAEARELVEAAARGMPEVRYVGWDVALTPGGPVLIEGNGAPDPGVQQVMLLCDGRGCRDHLRSLR